MKRARKMVDVVTFANRHIYSDLLDDMFRMRHRIVVEKWGWKIPNCQPGYDKDQFDTDETVYLIETDELRQRVVGCVRLNPTNGPHMMSELFAQHCNLKPVLRGPNVWECSRYVIDRYALKSRDLDLPTRRRLSIAVTEFCLSAGIDQLSWFTSQTMYNLILRIWDTRPLGLPQYFEDDDEVYIPAACTVDAAALVRQLSWFEDKAPPVTYAYLPLSAAPVSMFASLAA
jgi:N-acyl-L-homoserine lactone synthetase